MRIPVSQVYKKSDLQKIKYSSNFRRYKMNMQYIQGNPIFTKVNKVPKQYPYLTDNLETDVVIVGGGVSGSILGYYFSKNNINSVILEKKRIGHCSTSASTSLLQYDLDENHSKLIEVMPSKDIIRAYELGLVALKELDEFIKEYGNHCDYEQKDALLYTAKKLEIKDIQQEYNIRKENGFDVAYIDENSNPFSFDLKAGLISKNGGAQLDPYKYTHQLLDVSQNMGLKIYENTEVVKVNYLNDIVEVETSYGYKVRGKIIILATGYNTKMFTKRNFASMPTTFNIATKPVGNFDGWNNKILIRDNSDPYTYLRTTKDNQIIIGGEDIDFTSEMFSEDVAKEKYNILEQRLKNMFKDIKDIEIEYKYCGTFATTTDNLGFLGPDPNHNKLWYCLGYGGNGLLFSILGGMMLSKLYLGDYSKDLSLFKVDRFDK
jgi:glycine/D-amino acid oxidase-like deaminating enzyme